MRTSQAFARHRASGCCSGSTAAGGPGSARCGPMVMLNPDGLPSFLPMLLLFSIGVDSKL